MRSQFFCHCIFRFSMKKGCYSLKHIVVSMPIIAWVLYDHKILSNILPHYNNNERYRFRIRIFRCVVLSGALSGDCHLQMSSEHNEKLYYCVGFGIGNCGTFLWLKNYHVNQMCSFFPIRQFMCSLLLERGSPRRLQRIWNEVSQWTKTTFWC